MATTEPGETASPKPYSPRDQFLWELLEFVVKWSPYGGPSEEDALPLFGLPLPDLLKRFAEVVRDFGNRSDDSLTERQQAILRRATDLVPPTTELTAPQTAFTTCQRTEDNLGQSEGQWIKHRGLWRWRQGSQDDTSERSRPGRTQRR